LKDTYATYQEAIKTTSGSPPYFASWICTRFSSFDLGMFTFIVVGDGAHFLEQKFSYWNVKRPTRQAFSLGKSLLGHSPAHDANCTSALIGKGTNNQLVGQATAAEPLVMDFSIGDRSPSRSPTNPLLKLRLAENDGPPAPASRMEQRRAQKAVNPQKSPIPPISHIPIAKIIFKSWRSEHTQLDKLDIELRENKNPDESPPHHRPGRLDPSVTPLFARLCG
jgi:hypothetical protein